MMPKVLLVASMLLLLVGCGSKPNPEFETAMEKYLTNWEELVELFEGFKSADQIRAAHDRVRELQAGMDAVEEELEEATSGGIVREARKDPRVLEMMGRYRKAMTRISEDPEMARALGELMGGAPPQ